MMPKARVLLIARTIAGLCIAAGLIYGLYSKNSPPGVSALIVLAAVLFFVLRRRSGAFDKNPHIQEIAKLGSQAPLRDLAKSLGCFVAMMALVIGIALGVKHQVIPDNNLVATGMAVVILGGALAVGFFLFRALIPAMFGRSRRR
jgi:hypothetical protein